MPPLTDGPDGAPLDLDAARAKLDGAATGKQYWRSLDELAAGEGFQEMLRDEFPRQASEWTDVVSRRRFLSLMGASLALAGLSGCLRPPRGKVLPYVNQPEGMVLDRPTYYATAMSQAGVATGLLVESNIGRPTKVEGNPDHPASLGATDLFSQASILTMYDPERKAGVSNNGETKTWESALRALRAALDALGRPSRGQGFYLLTDTVGSPTLFAQIQDLQKRYPEMVWHQFEPGCGDNALKGAEIAFGTPVQPVYRMANAHVIVSLDADFLACGPAHLRYSRDFASRRTGDPKTMNRLYVVESAVTVTGAKADHRLPVRALEVGEVAHALARRLGVRGARENAALPAKYDKFLDEMAADLKERPQGTTLVVAGDAQPPWVHALAHAMNNVLGNGNGQPRAANPTVVYTPPVMAKPADRLASIKQLVDDIHADKVKVLLIASCNPVYSAPGDVRFLEALKKVPLRAHFNTYFDETSLWCHWFLPEAHYLESWGDARAYDGTASIVQPLIAPLYEGKTAAELIEELLARSSRPALELTRDYWRRWWAGQGSSGDFETFWSRSLHAGVIAGTAFPEADARFDADAVDRAVRKTEPPAFEHLEIVYRPDPTLFDGRWANNGWLQELPRPLTKICWDAPAVMSPNTAEQFGLGYKIGIRGGEHGEAWVDTIEMKVGDGRTIKSMPIWILPGHPDGTVTVYLGGGRTSAGKVGSKVGFDVNALRTTEKPWAESGLQIKKLAPTFLITCTQGRQTIEDKNKNLLRSSTAAHNAEHPGWVHDMDHWRHAGHKDGKADAGKAHDHKDHDQGKERPASWGEDHRLGDGPADRREVSFFPNIDHKGHKHSRHRPQWGMVINMSTCTGCSACVVACQAENNIPVVGKEQVRVGHEMHWLRIDRYFAGDPKKPESVSAIQQPIPCMQCEAAPCEVVCPVSATVHSHDGLNDMVYNRCVGTRYCSNNCPYKVRRFNWLTYTDYSTASLKLLYNPQVTVRSRGVMEKCTYCVQRIRRAEIVSEREGRAIRDGEVLTACQQACPTGAIVFGNLNPEAGKAKVQELKKSNLNYGLLTDLNTYPRTTYLAEVKNPNPKLAVAAEAGGGH